MVYAVKVQEPVFPDTVFKIQDFGAVPDGKTLCTDAINAAIHECSVQGGGQVVIPQGLWLTGPIILQDNVNVHLQAGALVIFTPEYRHYPFQTVDLNGVETVLVTAPIFGYGRKNIALTGAGIFDGNGQWWRPVKKYKLTENQWAKLVASGGRLDQTKQMWWPQGETAEDQRKLALRPRLLNLINCQNILLDGPTFQNSPMWNLHPLLCENVIIRNVSVRNPWYSQNGDGLDIESCRNVVVENSTFDVGDDAICLKSGKDEIGRQIGVPTQQVAIGNCTVYHGHGGFVIGSEMSGGVRDVTVEHCQFIGTDVGLRFKSTRGRGGVVENIAIKDIQMLNIEGAAISFDLYYERKKMNDETAVVSVETPQFQNISLDGITCRGADYGIFLRGLPEMPLKGLTFSNIDLTAKKGLSITNSVDHKFSQVRIADHRNNILFVK